MFTYTLPPELIAHTPANPRDSARLLTWPQKQEHPFHALPTLLNPGDLLVANESKVIPARLFATRPGRAGGPAINVEILLHRPLNTDLSLWEIFARPARRLKAGDVLDLPGLQKGTIGHTEDGQTLTLHLHAPNVATYLEAHGTTPLPPYIHTEDSAEIRQRYQTVYANVQSPGSVAAPTAGLHFTPQIFEQLEKNGIRVAKVTLHVGAGTFQNPTEEQLKSGKLHHEWAHLPPETAALIKQTKATGGKVIAVGTTTLRTLETWGKEMKDEGFTGDTDLFIRPGFQFNVVDRLLTNFHLPGSSLLMLVAAFIGEDAITDLYAHAIQNSFRFYSFGDTSLLTRKS